MVREIPLTKGYVALVDDEDYDYLMQWKWSVKESGHNVYAMRKYRKDGRQITISMHRQIMGNPRVMEVDHISRDGLDNRRGNLRVVTHRENAYNAKMHARNTSGYRGVYLNANKDRWVARIKFDGKNRTIGTFDTAEEAARAYDAAALKHHGPTAYQNFP